MKRVELVVHVTFSQFELVQNASDLLAALFSVRFCLPDKEFAYFL